MSPNRSFITMKPILQVMVEAGNGSPVLQVRTRVLNDDLADGFSRWYPNFTHTTEHHDLVAHPL